ncbi:LacI family DNA-binding transcriptional regulator [Gorillibacterium timonense]|uniref:LacI family DNA-binding transcriptional regulator n=1 Tax=Gorillibacterium timonense TaxID=1689269 RepID=UPI00071C5D17|nr:LacI family DNA-binding transcriptional regulator [Gorillibacterium timonense]
MVTIKDVAKAAGVSHTTVSRALNGNPLIKLETRERIGRIAREMNYIPNYSARSLVMKKPHTIGLFFSSLGQSTTASFLEDAIKGIRSELDESFNLSVSAIDEVNHLDSLSPQRFSGILIVSQSEVDVEFIRHVQKANIPFVVLNRQMNEPGISWVAANDRDGTRAAIDYAIACGHRKLAILEGKPGYKSSMERKLGFLDSLKAAGISLPSEYQIAGDYSMESGFAAMEELLELPDPPTFVFCSNDDMAIGALKACYSRKLDVPGALSLIGFDDMPFARYANPALTTIHKPTLEICKTGIRMLLLRLSDPSTESEQRLIETSLVLRDSVARLTPAEE